MDNANEASPQKNRKSVHRSGLKSFSQVSLVRSPNNLGKMTDEGCSFHEKMSLVFD